MKSSPLSLTDTEPRIGMELRPNSDQQAMTMKYTCDICRGNFSEQFKFFEHLKAHYENPPASTSTSTPTPSATSEIESANQIITSSSCSNNKLVADHDHATLFRDVANSTIKIEDMQETTPIVLPGNIRLSVGMNVSNLPSEMFEKVNEFSEVSENCGEYINNDKQILRCPKCTRTFRKEKTYKTHIASCRKGDDHDIEVRSSKKPKTCKVDVVIDETLSEEFVDESEPVEIQLERESDMEFEFEGDDEDLLDENVCPSCDQMFPSRPKLEAHIKKLHPDLTSLCDTDKPATKKKKNASGRKSEVLKCSECQRIFNHRNSLVYHMRSHTGERPHQCEQCGKSFFATSALKVHMRLHSGEKPYKCDHCGRHFRQWGDLKYHVISIHSDIRQYQCEFCGKDFARKYSLIVHRRIHTGERNYKCDFCEKCFRAASYLQNHRRIHTGEKPHSCNVCAKPFRVRSDMKRHMASHNRDQSNLGNLNNNINTLTPSTMATSSSSSTIVANSSSSAPGMNVNISCGPPVVSAQSSLTPGGNQLVTSSIPEIAVRRMNQSVGGTQHLIQYEVQHVVDNSSEGVISGDLNDGTPINITVSQDANGTDGSTLSVAAVATLQDLPEGVIYQNRDGQMEAVTIRENSTGTLYVWPVFMN